MGNHVETTQGLCGENGGGRGSSRKGLFEGLGHLLIGQLDLLIIWTGGGKLFPSIGIAQVPMHSPKHIRNGESSVLLTYHLGVGRGEPVG